MAYRLSLDPQSGQQQHNEKVVRSKRRRYFVEMDGMMWTFGATNYRKLLRCGVAGEYYDLERLGHRIGRVDLHLEPIGNDQQLFVTALAQLDREG
jgi:hypothetical protein